MKKKNYSLTAKERKELKSGRATADVRDNKKNKNISASKESELVCESNGNDAHLSQFDDLTQAEAGVAISNPRKKRLTVIVSIAMILLFLTGIVVTMLLIEAAGKPQGNPTATVLLSDGKELEFVIYEDTAPIAAANFMFLSMKGYFDGTVIHDNQGGWLRFMGMLDYSTHRSEKETYTKKFSGFDKYDYEWAQANNSNIFWYRLKKDTTSIDFQKTVNTEGLLCFAYSYSSTMFQVSCEDTYYSVINGTNRPNFTVMGKYANDATLEYLRELRQLSTQKNGSWENPDEIITIESIKINNYDKTKWKGNKWIGKKGILSTFDTYIGDLNGYSNHSTRYVNNL